MEVRWVSVQCEMVIEVFAAYQAFNHNEADQRVETRHALLNDDTRTQTRRWLTLPSSCHQLEQDWLISWAGRKWSFAIGCWRKTTCPSWRETSEASGCCTPSAKESLEQWRERRALVSFTATAFTNRWCNPDLCLIQQSDRNELEGSWCVLHETVKHQGSLKHKNTNGKYAQGSVYS